jgi:hypothetical protein
MLAKINVGPTGISIPSTIEDEMMSPVFLVNAAASPKQAGTTGGHRYEPIP